MRKSDVPLQLTTSRLFGCKHLSSNSMLRTHSLASVLESTFHITCTPKKNIKKDSPCDLLRRVSCECLEVHDPGKHWQASTCRPPTQRQYFTLLSFRPCCCVCACLSSNYSQNSLSICSHDLAECPTVQSVIIACKPQRDAVLPRKDKTTRCQDKIATLVTRLMQLTKRT
jgi:hypothetical protein